MDIRQTLARNHLLATALAYLGTPYIWGGDDPSGFDCSGFVLECLKSAGLISENQDLTADQLLHKFACQKLDSPRPGVLQFLCDRSGKAYHVVICLDEHFQIGASGGSSMTTSAASAWKNNAYVKIRPIARTPDCQFLDPCNAESTR